MSVNQQQVISLLENVLFETPTQAAANAAIWAANPAATSVSSLASAMASSGEEKIAGTVIGYYLTALGRAPTADEIHFYVKYAEQGLSQSQIVAGQVAASTWSNVTNFFANSHEFASRGGLDYSMGQTAALFEAVPWLYESVLNRTPTSAEIAYYDNQVANGLDLGVLFHEFTASAEFHANTDSQIQTALVANGAAVASGQLAPTTIGATVALTPPPPAPVTVAAPPPSTPHIDWSGAMTGATTLPSGDTALIINTSGVTYTTDTVTDTGNTITALTFNETGAGSTLKFNLTDTALASVTFIGNIAVGINSHSSFFFAPSVTLVDLTRDTDTTDTVYLVTQNSTGATVKLGNQNADLGLSGHADTVTAGNGNVTIYAGTGSAGSFTFGTGSNFLELGGYHAGATVTVGAGASFNAASPTSNLTIADAANGLQIQFGSQTGLTLDTAGHITHNVNVLAALVAQITTPGKIEYGDDGSNSYLVESDNGTTAAGHVTVIYLENVVVTGLSTTGHLLTLDSSYANN